MEGRLLINPDVPSESNHDIPSKVIRSHSILVEKKLKSNLKDISILPQLRSKRLAIKKALSEKSTNLDQDKKSNSISSGLNLEATQHLVLNPKSHEISAEVIWSRCLSIIQKQLDPQIFNAWIRPLVLSSLGEEGASFSAIIEAPNKFCCEHIKRHYTDNICQALLQTIGTNNCTISFKISTSVTNNTYARRSKLAFDSLVGSIPQKSVNNSTSQSSELTLARLKTTEARKVNLSADECNLNGKYSFSNFVVGACNQFAHAVSLKVAESPGQVYNPLFLYGGVGLGKTHLANAIGNACRRRKNKVLVVSSERFVSELIFSLRSNAMNNFKNKFRSLDVLIVDDIQFLVGKERTQEEFFHTFNELHGMLKQIIVTCDKLPQEMVGLDERLRTRFISGVSADLQTPDFETRVAILIKKAENFGLLLPEKIAQLFAERISSNVRELEGVLNRFQALCSFHQCPPSEDLALEILKTIAPSRISEITPEKIFKLVAFKYNVSLSDLSGKRRTANIALSRQIAMYLCRRFTNRSFPEIGAMFGGRDHSTAIHAYKTISDKKSNEKQFSDEIKDLENRLVSEK